MLPLWWQPVLAEGWARKPELTALPVLRSLLISSVAALVPTDDIRSAAADATAAAAAAAAATAAADAAAADAADADIWTAVRTDAEQAADGALPDALPLWPEGEDPFERNWAKIKARVAKGADAADWRFWTAWYDALLAGHLMLPDPARTWRMLEQIALIDPKTWDAGPEAVNPRIREIWELHRLSAEVAALRAEKDALLAGRATVEQRSHNAPPGLVEDHPALAGQVTIIWAGLDDASEELGAEEPHKARLAEIAKRMLAALRAVAAYCGKVGDTALMSAAKVGGGTVGAAVLDHVVNNGRLMQFAKDLLAYAVGG